MLKVGGEVDAFCTKCQLTLAHTIHAVMGGKPVKVECNTCHGIHRYRGTLASSAGSTARPSGGAAGLSSRANARQGRRPAPGRERAAVVGFEELLSSRKGAAQPYSAKRTFAVDDVVDHPTFGRGFVSAVRDGGKIEVTFRSDVKVLVHGRA